MKRYVKNGWLYISVSGTSKEIGYGYGQAIADTMTDIQKMLRFHVYETTGREWDYFIMVAKRLFLPLIKEKYYEYYLEMLYMAKGINSSGGSITLEEIVAWNNYFTITSDWYNSKYKMIYDKNYNIPIDNSLTYKKASTERCSAFICNGDYTKDGKIVCGHNNFSDFVEGQFAKQVLDIKPINGNRMLIQGFVGWIWSGTDFFVTEAGILGTETTIGGFDNYSFESPISCRIRTAMQYGNTFEDYIKILTTNNSGDYSNSWYFGNINTNEIMRIELGRTYVNVERTSNGYFIGFNATYDPRIRNLECSDTGFNDIRRHQGARRVRLTQLMDKYKGEIDLEIGKKIMGDHYDVYLKKINPCSRTVCSHYNMDAREYMSDPSRPLPYQPRGACDGNLITTKLAQNMSFCLKYGSSCNIPFDSKTFFKEHIEWSQYENYVVSRPNQPWTIFSITQPSSQTQPHSTKKNINKKHNHTVRNNDVK
jgi:hypothetical protein